MKDKLKMIKQRGTPIFYYFLGVIIIFPLIYEALHSYEITTIRNPDYIDQLVSTFYTVNILIILLSLSTVTVLIICGIKRKGIKIIRLLLTVSPIGFMVLKLYKIFIIRYFECNKSFYIAVESYFFSSQISILVAMSMCALFIFIKELYFIKSKILNHHFKDNS